MTGIRATRRAVILAAPLVVAAFGAIQPAYADAQATADRPVAGEVTPSYTVSDHVTVGGYYLFSRGVDHDATRDTHFAAARAEIVDIPLTGGYTLQFSPQVYYLHTGGKDGVYAYTGVTVSKRGMPMSVSATVNQPIESDVVGGQASLWNVSVQYAFP